MCIIACHTVALVSLHGEMGIIAALPVGASFIGVPRYLKAAFHLIARLTVIVEIATITGLISATAVMLQKPV